MSAPSLLKARTRPPPDRRATRVGAVLSTYPSAGGAHQYALTLLEELRALAMEEGEVECLLLADEPPPWVTARYPAHAPFTPPDDLRSGAAPAEKRGGVPPWVRRIVGDGQLGRLLREARRGVQQWSPRHRFDPERVRWRPDVGAWLDRHRVDWVIHSTATSLGFEARRPYVMPIHDLQHRLQPRFPEVSRNGERAWREYLFRNGARYATLLLVDSEVGKEDVLDAYGPFGVTEDRVKVLPFVPPRYLCAVPDAEERARVRAGYALPERYLFYPAQFWPHKNHLRIVQALGRLRARGEEVHVVFCGSYADPIRERTYHGLCAEVRRQRVAGQVHHLGFVPDAEMAALYAEAAGVLMPTFFGPTNIPILEAWAFGKPVLTSDIRGVREQAGDAALLVDPTSVEAMAEGIGRLWSDATLGARLAERGRLRLGAWTRDQFRERLGECVREADARVRSGDAPFARERAHRP